MIGLLFGLALVNLGLVLVAWSLCRQYQRARDEIRQALERMEKLAAGQSTPRFSVRAEIGAGVRRGEG
jgi:hypothetical protein